MSSHSPVGEKLIPQTHGTKLRSKGILLVAFIGLAAVFYIQNKNAARVPASKFEALVVSSGKFSQTQKLAGPFVVEITEKDRDGDEITLAAKLTASQPIANTNLSWILPNEVKLIEGDLAHQNISLSAGDEFDVDLVVNAPTSENYQIHLQAQTGTGKIKMGTVAQFNTRDQKQLDRAKAALYQRSKKDLANR